jgi:hypothetical protein
MRRWIIAVAFGALALTGCRKNMQPAPSQAPERVLSNTTFPHSAHTDVGCADCHEGTDKWTKLGEYRVPPAEKCQECHEKDAAHTPPAREQRTDYGVRFSHANHLPRLKDRKDACAACHQVLPEPGETRKLTPPMTACTACHAHKVEVSEARCTPCHVSLKRYGLKPIEQFTEFSHGVNFVREHGRLAETSAATCAQCHDQTFCATCHATATLAVRPEIRFPEDVTSDFIHRGDYVSRHSHDVQRDPASCKKCHGSRFCDSCHETQQLSGRLGAGGRSPHPPFNAGWREEHARQARNNIVNCSGCHDQGAASICVACHQVGGTGGNPHPSGWTKRHSTNDISKNVACRACHNR